MRRQGPQSAHLCAGGAQPVRAWQGSGTGAVLALLACFLLPTPLVLTVVAGVRVVQAGPRASGWPCPTRAS